MSDSTLISFDLGMHRAWPRLLKRLHQNKQTTTQEERELVISARTWFCLYLFEHQYVPSPGICLADVNLISISECPLEMVDPLY